MVEGAARRGQGFVRAGFTFALCAMGIGWLLGAAPTATALEALDGKVQAHGFVEMQIRGMAGSYGVDGNELDLAQWYNVLNVEVELDILDDVWGPFDLLSAFVRVEGRYDCIYTHGCAMIQSADTFGDEAGDLPKRLRDAKDPDYAGVIEVGPSIKRIPDQRPAPMGGLRETEPFGGGDLNQLVVADPGGPILYEDFPVQVNDLLGSIRRDDIHVIPDPGGNILRDLTDDGMNNPILYSYDPTQSSGILADNVGFRRDLSPDASIFLDVFVTGQNYYQGLTYAAPGDVFPVGGFLMPRCATEFGCPGEPGSLVGPEQNPIFADYIIDRVGFPGFDTFNSINGGDGIPGTADDPAIYLLGEFRDYRWALKERPGPAGGTGMTQLIGPWLPKNTVHPLAQAKDLANPLRGVYTPSLYTATGQTFRSRRYYDLSMNLMGTGPAATNITAREKEYLWNDPMDISAGFTDLVDPTPESLQSFLSPGPWLPFGGDPNSTDYYRVAPKDNNPQVNAFTLGSPIIRFGGDYSGIVPCVRTDRATAPNVLTLNQAQITGNSHEGGCLDFRNVRVTGGQGELPLRPAPDRSNLFPDFDLRYAQGLYVPSPGLVAYINDGGDWDKSGFNINEWRRSWNRGYSQEDNKELKEAFIDAEFLESRLWVRLGLQNIVWGKTELFRTTDQFNPVDIALAGVLAGLEESRIALWSARFVYSLYDVGPLEDVRLEFAVNLDDFEPIDLGACGEPYTINLVCGITAGLWAHGTLGIGIAGVDRPPSFWEDGAGLEYGVRMEWRWDRFSFALTNYSGYDDLPYADAIYYYDRSVDFGLVDGNAAEFVMGAGRPLASGFETGCTGMWGGEGDDVWASANRDPKSYTSTSLAGVGRDPACLKPGGAAGGLNQNGFTVARDDDGDVIYARMDEFGNPQFDLFGGTDWVDDGNKVHPSLIDLGANSVPLIPITCATPDEFEDCEPLRYEVGLAEDTFNGELFAEGWSPQNALENHTTNQQSFAWICTATLTIGASLDAGACAFTLFASPNFLSRGFVDIVAAELFSCILAGDPGVNCTGKMGSVSNAIQGSSPFRDVHFVALNRDYNDGVITASVPVQSTGIFFANRQSPTGVSFSRPAFRTAVNFFNALGPIDNVWTFLQGPEDMLTLDSTLTAEQRALLGCGPFYGTRCDTSVRTANQCSFWGIGCNTGGGLDFMNMEANVLVQSFVGIEGTDLSDPIYTNNADHPEYAQWAAGGENFAGTEWADSGIWLTTSGLPQPGTMEFQGGPVCTRYSKEIGDVIVLPGCRGINGVKTRDREVIMNEDGGFLTFFFDDGYDPGIDGCVLGETIAGYDVRGEYRDGTEVDLTPCWEGSTHKEGWYYVQTAGKAGLVDWDRLNPAASPTSRDGSGTLWHPYAGCYADPSQAIAGDACVSVDQNHIDNLKVLAMTDVNAALLVARLSQGGVGVVFAGDEPRDFEQAFFIEDINLQSQIFRSELAAFSWNFMMFLVQASCDKDFENIATDPECFNPQDQFAFAKCSYANPQLCTNVKGFFGAAGVLRNTVRAGGNERFGRRTFLWHSGGELNLKYNRRNVMGFSMDFGEDTTKSNWGVEFTWVAEDYFFNNDDFNDNVSKSNVLNLTVSVDRPTFINFLNANRTFFINSQWFFQYITEWEDGFVTPGPWNVLFTVAAFTGYFQDRLNPVLVAVYDIQSGSGALLPSVQYRFTEALSVAVGMNWFFGETRFVDMPVREFAPASNRAGKRAYQDGVDNAIASFRDKDEIWLKLRWTF